MDKVIQRVCEREGCPNLLGRLQKQYCSKQCYALARQTGQERACAHCGKRFYRKPALVAKSGGKYCTHECYVAALREVALRVQLTCRVCEGPMPTRDRRRKYCSFACTAESKRKRWPEHHCEACGKPFSRPPSQMGARARFCSLACRGNSRAARQELTCVRCGEQFSATPTEIARGRQFCSRRCYLGDAEKREITCVVCGKTKMVYASHLQGGRGKYCSVACRGRARRTRVRKRRHCAYDQKLFSVLQGPGEPQRKYCCRDHYMAARRRAAQTEVACAVCGAGFAPHDRGQRYCSLSCANRGRQYERPVTLSDRNRRILELRDAGMKAPKIAVALAEERAEWTLDPAAIRMVIARELARQSPRVAPERDVALL